MEFVKDEFEKWARETGFSFGEDDAKVEDISNIIQTGQFKNAVKLMMKHFIPPERVSEFKCKIGATSSKALVATSSISSSAKAETGHSINDRESSCKLEATLAYKWSRLDKLAKKIERISEKLSSTSVEHDNRRKKEIYNFKTCQSLRPVIEYLQNFNSQLQMLNETVGLVSDGKIVTNRARTQDKLDEWKQEIYRNITVLDRTNLLAQLITRVNDELEIDLTVSHQPIKSLLALSSLHRLIVESNSKLIVTRKSLKEKESTCLSKNQNTDAAQYNRRVNSFLNRYIETAKYVGLSSRSNNEYEELKEKIRHNKRKIRELCANSDFRLNFCPKSFKASLTCAQKNMKNEAAGKTCNDIRCLLKKIPLGIELEMKMRQLTRSDNFKLWRSWLSRENYEIASGQSNTPLTLPDCDSLLAELAEIEIQGDNYVSDIILIKNEIENRTKAINDVCDLGLQLLNFWNRNLIAECLAHDEGYVDLRRRCVYAIEVVVNLEKELFEEEEKI